MDFSILGPLEVHEGGTQLPLRGTNQRALLALLLLHAEGHEERLCSLVELGYGKWAKWELEVMARLAHELRQPSHEWLVTVHRALLAVLEGRFAEAEELIPRSRRLGERAQSWNAELSYRLQLYVLRHQQGRTGEVEELVRRSVDEYPTYPVWRCVLAPMDAELGRPTEASGGLETLAGEGPPPGPGPVQRPTQVRAAPLRRPGDVPGAPHGRLGQPGRCARLIRAVDGRRGQN